MAGKRNKFELADAVRKFGKSLIERGNLSPVQTKALHNILQCRTASLGGHEEVCDHCGVIRYSYNSCGDRHCPKCQGNKQALWIEDLQEAALPVKHYHIIFTVPHCLNEVCLWDQRMYYNILFSSVWRTLHSFGYTHYGVETGAVAVLHSWGQNLSLHPHIHCIVPATGYSLRGEWKHIGKNGHYLYPVFQLSDTFQGKFLNSLKRKLKKKGMLEGFDKQVQKAWKTRWVVDCEASMAGAEHVIRYLGQYTHRVAISNHRILDMTDTHVTFVAKDYRDRAIQKPVTFDGVEFLRRFCLHVFPKRFVRIRRYGIYNPTTIRNLDLQFIPEKKPDIEQLASPKEKETTAERIRRLTGFDAGLCPVCKKGRMRVIREIPRIRSPAAHLPTILLSMLH
jgi:hypothetical protein